MTIFCFLPCIFGIWCLGYIPCHVYVIQLFTCCRHIWRQAERKRKKTTFFIHLVSSWHRFRWMAFYLFTYLDLSLSLCLIEQLQIFTFFLLAPSSFNFIIYSLSHTYMYTPFEVRAPVKYRIITKLIEITLQARCQDILLSPSFFDRHHRLLSHIEIQWSWKCFHRDLLSSTIFHSHMY